MAAQLIKSQQSGRPVGLSAVSFGPPSRHPMRDRLTAAFDRFLDVRALSDQEIARQLRALEVDIAIDLKGYTTDSRPGILRWRPCPVQVNYLGYPGTMGADYIDYLIADPVVIPPGSEPFYSERVVRLPDCYQPNDRQRRIAVATPGRREAGLPENGFVFCCFNNNYKLTPDVFSLWMRLLHRVEGSVLWLLEDNAAAAANLRREAAARDIDPSRLVFAPRADLPDHLARHRLADLFLDTLPVNAHTTASDALWAGLPVLTCVGEAFAGRVAASLLRAAGLPELVKDYGWLTILAKPLYWLLDQLHKVIANWGWSIVALVFLLKVAFYWLNAKAYASMAKMKAINPKIMEMRERLKDNPQQMQQEMMRIYREEKVNPMGGCFPIVVQIPVFIALYWVLLSSVEMRNAPWILWIKDLSTPDPYYILPLLMTVTSMLQTALNPAPPDPMQAKMMWIMPLVFSVMFFFFPAGLVLYWLTNNILSIAQQWVINTRMGVPPQFNLPKF